MSTWNEDLKAKPGEAHFTSKSRRAFIYCLVPAGRDTSLCGYIQPGEGSNDWKAIPRGGTMCPDCDEILQRSNEDERSSEDELSYLTS